MSVLLDRRRALLALSTLGAAALVPGGLGGCSRQSFIGDVDVQVWSDSVWERPTTEVLAAVRSHVDQLLAVPTRVSELPVSV